MSSAPTRPQLTGFSPRCGPAVLRACPLRWTPRVVSAWVGPGWFPSLWLFSRRVCRCGGWPGTAGRLRTFPGTGGRAGAPLGPGDGAVTQGAPPASDPTRRCGWQCGWRGQALPPLRGAVCCPSVGCSPRASLLLLRVPPPQRWPARSRGHRDPRLGPLAAPGSLWGTRPCACPLATLVSPSSSSGSPAQRVPRSARGSPQGLCCLEPGPGDHCSWAVSPVSGCSGRAGRPAPVPLSWPEACRALGGGDTDAAPAPLRAGSGRGRASRPARGLRRRRREGCRSQGSRGRFGALWASENCFAWPGGLGEAEGPECQSAVRAWGRRVLRAALALRAGPLPGEAAQQLCLDLEQGGGAQRCTKRAVMRARARGRSATAGAPGPHRPGLRIPTTPAQLAHAAFGHCSRHN